MKRILLVLCILLTARISVAQNVVGPLELDSIYPPAVNTGRVQIDASAQKDDYATCYVAYLNRTTKQISPIIVGGVADYNSTKQFAIAKYNPDLTPDQTFGTNGLSLPFGGNSMYPNDIILTGNNKVWAAGYYDPAQSGNGRAALYSILGNGKSDPSFGSNGFLVDSEAIFNAPGNFTTVDSMKRLASDGANCLLGMGYTFGTGNSTRGFLAMRADAAGHFDTTFGRGGAMIIPAPIANARGHLCYEDSTTNEQHILFVGISTDATPEIILGRLRQDGRIDSGFGTNGVLHTGLLLQGGSWFTSKIVRYLLLDRNGKTRFFNQIVVVAPLMPASAKLPVSVISFTIDGTLDTFWGAIDGGNGIVTSPTLSVMDSATSLTVTNDGSVLICGMQNAYPSVAKFLASGRIDSAFGYHGITQLERDFGTQHYSLIGLTGLGGGGGNPGLAGIGTIDGGATKKDFLIARYIGVPILKFSPPSVSFGDVDTGTSREITVNITNYDSVLHIIDTVTASRPELSIMPVDHLPISHISLAPGATYSFIVRYAPNSFNPMDADIKISDSIPTKQSRTERSVRVFGHPVASQAGVQADITSTLSLTPNPATSNISIVGAELLRYRIMDALGREIDARSSQERTIDVSKFPAGIYFIDLTTREGRCVRKITVQR